MGLCVWGHPEYLHGSQSVHSDTSLYPCLSGPGMSPSHVDGARRLEPKFLLLNFPFLQMLFYRTPGSLFCGQCLSNSFKNDMHPSAVLTPSRTPTAWGQAGQVALPKARMLVKWLHLLDTASVKIMIKSHVRHNTTVANYKTYYLAERQVQIFFPLSKETRVHSCFRFVLFLTICSKSPFMMSVTEDKPNTFWVNTTLIPPAVGKQINTGSR